MGKSPDSEKTIENAILEYLRGRGVFCWKNQSTGIYDPRKRSFRKPSKFHLNGVSDILGIFDGKFLAIEVKRLLPKKTYPSPAQRDFIASVKEQGGVAFVARSVEDVLKYLPGSTDG